MILSWGVPISQVQINSLKSQYDVASAEVRKRITGQDFSPLSNEKDFLRSALTRVLDSLDDLFRLPNPLSTEFTQDERELIEDHAEGSTNLAEYKIGRAYISIYRAKALIYESSKITPESVSDANTPQVVKDIYALSDFVCQELIPLMNARQVEFYSSLTKEGKYSSVIHDFGNIEKAPKNPPTTADLRKSFFEHITKDTIIKVDGEEYKFDSVNPVGHDFFFATRPGKSLIETFNTAEVRIEARGQRLEKDEVFPVVSEILKEIDSGKIYMWKIIPIINNNIEKFTPEERRQIQEKLADRWIKDFSDDGAVSLKDFVKDYEGIFTGFSGQKAVELCNALTSYYLRCIQMGQLKDAVGIGAALELFGLDDVKVDLANAQRLQFLLMHLPKQFWLDLSGSINAGPGFLPVVQVALKGYMAIGAPERPALSQFQAKMLAIAKEIKECGDDNSNRLAILRRFVAAEQNGLVATVFNATDPADEARQIRGGIRDWLIARGKPVPAEGEPLPLRYHPESEMYLTVDPEAVEVEKRVAREVRASRQQFWDTLVSDPEAALAEHRERVATAQAQLEPPKTNPKAIFAGSGSDTALRMIGRGDDTDLQEYLQEVVRLILQSYFPNTPITDKDVRDVLAMRELVMIMLNENAHMQDLSADDRADVMRPLGMGADLEKLEVGSESALRLLEYRESPASPVPA